MLTQARLKELIHYNPTTGIFMRKFSRMSKIVGSPDKDGYLTIGIDGKNLKSHRLAFLYMNGRMPDGEVDHVNLKKSDNRFENLRDASRGQNMTNTKTYSNNASGAKGVHWHKKTMKWQASIMSNGKCFYLGLHEDIESAAAAVRAKRIELHGDFARHE